MKFEAKDTVRLGVIGIGGRGNSLIENFSAIPQVRVTAICDTVKDKVDKQQAKLERAGKQPPALYHSSDHAFEELVKRDDIDLVVISTPWIWHAPMALAAMKQGKHVAVEVPAARTIEECWDLVNTSESTRRHCIQLENCCYGYNELLVLNMVRAGLFGDITHGAAAYNHDLREHPVLERRRRPVAALRKRQTAMATSIPRTAWVRWRTTWTSTAATGSSTWYR